MDDTPNISISCKNFEIFDYSFHAKKSRLADTRLELFSNYLIILALVEYLICNKPWYFLLLSTIEAMIEGSSRAM